MRPSPVLIVPGALAHAPALHAMLAMHEVALPYFGSMLTTGQLDQLVAEHWSGAPEPGRTQITACLPDDGQVVGAASLSGGALSYFVTPACWGQGIATRMLRHLLAHAADARAAMPLTAMIYRENRASIALVEKLGFRFMGLAPPRNHTFAGRAMLKYVLPVDAA